MRVHPACQRRGYGRPVLQALEAKACELGFVKIVLDTTTSQGPAIAFDSAHCYVQAGQASSISGRAVAPEPVVSGGRRCCP